MAEKTKTILTPSPKLPCRINIKKKNHGRPRIEYQLIMFSRKQKCGRKKDDLVTKDKRYLKQRSPANKLKKEKNLRTWTMKNV
jgi:hypothetical protein